LWVDPSGSEEPLLILLLEEPEPPLLLLALLLLAAGLALLLLLAAGLALLAGLLLGLAVAAGAVAAGRTAGHCIPWVPIFFKARVGPKSDRARGADHQGLHDAHSPNSPA
jgi:hypothetical protein